MEKNDNFKEELETQYNILIKASAQKEKKRYISMLIILCSTLISVLISIIFSYQAYRNSIKAKDEVKLSSETYYETIVAKYNGNNTLELTNIGNGYTLATPRTIQVQNEGTEEINYDLKIDSIKTSLLSTSNLIYTIIKNDETIISQELPLSDKTILANEKIEPDQTITYTIKVTYQGTMESNNYSNYYNANIFIESKNKQIELLE